MPNYICTMGPSIYHVEKLLELQPLGLRTIRFNMSHIDYDIQSVFHMIEEVEQKTGVRIETLLDTCGAEARIKTKTPKEIATGDICVLEKDFTIDMPYENVLEPNDILQIDDGKIKLRVIGKSPFTLLAITNGKLKDSAGIYSQKLSAKLPFLPPKDFQHLHLAFSLDFDWIACSFVKSAQDIEEVLKLKKQYPNCHTKIMAKIETIEAITNLDSIIAICDGIMIARGDLAVAYPIHMITALESYIAHKVNKAGLPLAIGTGFLRSMKKNDYPERAEVTDLYYAFDLSQTIMFSGETAISDNPANILTTANAIFDSKNYSEEKIKKYENQKEG